MFMLSYCNTYCLFFQAEDAIRAYKETGVQTCALPISESPTFTNRNAIFASSLAMRISEARAMQAPAPAVVPLRRSEERRVGKECGTRWRRKHARKTTAMSAKQRGNIKRRHLIINLVWR